jgi:hypothetical protein
MELRSVLEAAGESTGFGNAFSICRARKAIDRRSLPIDPLKTMPVIRYIFVPQDSSTDHVSFCCHVKHARDYSRSW